ncbi:MAG: glycosyltransferase family 2 protein [Rhodanobacteraceae bacterium]|nr:MAG: glycosyltransferase family 2 protein [Rhodanobacteraceae bacterium]
MPLSIDVIVRTLADAARSELLFRALDSIQGQTGVDARPIVVVNGQRFDPATLAALERRPGIVLHCEQQASAQLARAAGRRLVTAPYFAYLDDDDVLVAGSLREPLQWLEDHPDCDVMINNGYFAREGQPLVRFTDIPSHVDHPALSLLDESWLQPGAFMCRTESIPPVMLGSEWSNLEWTHLAFELCAERKHLHFMDIPTVHYNDTPGSMSKEMRQHEVALDLLQLVCRDPRLDAEVRRGAYRKFLRSLHDLAWGYWQRGQYGRAWRAHLTSLRPPYTFRYLLFSRKLMWPAGGGSRPRLPSL